MLIYTGRFQPFHNGHLYIINELQRTYVDDTICIAIIRDVPINDRKSDFDRQVDMMLRKERNPYDADTTLKLITEIIHDNNLNNVVTTLMPRASDETWDLIESLFGENRVWVFTENQVTEDLWEKEKSGFYASKGEKLVKIPINKTINGSDIRCSVYNNDFIGLKEVLPDNVIRYLRDHNK